MIFLRACSRGGVDSCVGFDADSVGYLDGWYIGGWSDICAMTLRSRRYIMDGGTCV